MTRRCALIDRGNGERESRSDAERRFHPDRAPQSFHDLPADCQAETGAGDIPIGQTDKRQEDTSLILRRDAEAIVCDSDDPFRPAALGRDVNLDRLLTAVFHRVADEVLEEAYQLNFIARNDWLPIHGHHRAACADVEGQVLRGLRHGVPKIDGPERFHHARAGEGEQIFH